METEKQLCFSLAELNMSTPDEDHESKKERIERGISKCRDTITVMEKKLKKVLDRVKQSQQSNASKKKRENRSHSKSSNNSSRSKDEESKHESTHHAMKEVDMAEIEAQSIPIKIGNKRS